MSCKKTWGLRKKNILALRIFDVDGSLRNTYNEVKQRFLKHPNVLAAAASASLPGEGWTSRKEMVLDPSGAAFEIRQYGIDEDLFPMIGVDILAGRNFSVDTKSDFESAYILNETAVEKFGLENPVGKPFKLLDNEGWIIGVVEDFHMRRLTEKLRANAFCFCAHVHFAWSTCDSLPETSAKPCRASKKSGKPISRFVHSCMRFSMTGWRSITANTGAFNAYLP